MSLAVVVTRNAPDRHRGFLASVMLEVSPGVYVSPSISRGVRARIWAVMMEWSPLLPPDGSVTMIWPDTDAPAGLGIEILGAPKSQFVELDGIWLERADLTQAHRKVLVSAGLIEN